MHLNAKHIFTIVFITAIFFAELETKESLKPQSKMHADCPSGCPAGASFTYSDNLKARWALIH